MKTEEGREKLKTIRKHLLGLFILVVIGPLPLYYSEPSDIDSPSLSIYFLQTLSGIFMVLAPPVYANIYFLIPKFLEKKRYVLYALSGFVVVLIWGVVAAYAEPWTDEHWFGMPAEVVRIQDGFFAILFVLIISTLMNLSYRWFVQLSRIKQVENDRLNIELSMLRNQINPHFFFNTLNNLYSMALEKADETPQVILKLSDMMRYTIYDCKESEVEIGQEINYLENYITLQQMRHDTSNSIKFHKEVADKTIKIAPMILIVFLENAFKHGLEMSENGFINIQLKVTESELYFSIENSYEIPVEELPVGLGLDNVKRRLSLIYSRAHTLDIKQDDDVYKLELSIQFNTV
jgi:two-component system, LytTR family, sensor kinase